MECEIGSMVIGLAGLTGSGKTSVAVRLAEALNCPVASFGAYVRSIALQTGRSDARGVLQGISEQLMASPGPRGLTRDVLNSAGWNRNGAIIVDGIRHPSVVAALNAEASPLPVILVYVDVRSGVRHERLAARDHLTAGDVARIDLHSTERYVETQVRALADVILAANLDLEEKIATVINALNSRMRGSESAGVGKIQTNPGFLE